MPVCETHAAENIWHGKQGKALRWGTKVCWNEEMAVSAVVARHVSWHRPPHWPAPPPRQPPCKERRASPLAAFLKWRTCRAPSEASPAQPSQPQLQPQPRGLLFFFLLFNFPPPSPLCWSFYKPLQIWVETDFSQLALRLNFTAQHTLRHCQKLDSVPGKILTVNFPTGIEGARLPSGCPFCGAAGDAVTASQSLPWPQLVPPSHTAGTMRRDATKHAARLTLTGRTRWTLHALMYKYLPLAKVQAALCGCQTQQKTNIQGKVFTAALANATTASELCRPGPQALIVGTWPAAMLPPPRDVWGHFTCPLALWEVLNMPAGPRDLHGRGQPVGWPKALTLCEINLTAVPFRRLLHGPVCKVEMLSWPEPPARTQKLANSYSSAQPTACTSWRDTTESSRIWDVFQQQKLIDFKIYSTSWWCNTV